MPESSFCSFRAAFWALVKLLLKNARQIEQTNASIQNQQQRLDELGNELRDAGIDTDRLTEENDRLGVLARRNRVIHIFGNVVCVYPDFV